MLRSRFYDITFTPPPASRLPRLTDSRTDSELLVLQQ